MVEGVCRDIPGNRIAMYMRRLAFVSACVCSHMYAYGTYVHNRAYRLRDKGVRFQWAGSQIIGVFMGAFEINIRLGCRSTNR